MRTLGMGLLAILAATFVLLSNGTPVAAEPTDKEKSELATKVYTLLKDRCASCHGADAKVIYGKKGTLNYILDYAKLISETLIDTESPEESPLYKGISEGNMPRELDKDGKPKTKKKLAQPEIDLVLNWIKAGAPKWSAVAGSLENAAIKWTEIKGSGPSKRTGHAMSEGPGKSVVLFGGTDTNTEASLGDTWVLSGGVWKQLKTKDAPPASTALRMAYDSKRGVCVLVGVEMSTWEFDGKGWKEVKTDSKPPVRKSFSIAYDPGQGHIMIFGGIYVYRSKTIHIQKPYNDAWAFDGNTWKKLELKNSPDPRNGAAMAYSAASQAIVLFGGADNTNKFADTYLLKGGEWTKQEPDDTPRNAPFLLMASSVHDTILICSKIEGLAETWLWKGNGWVKGPEGPKARSGAGIAYDGNGKCILFFGGTIGDRSEDGWWQLSEAK